MTVNQNVLVIYDNFTSYAENHTLREVADIVKPDWEIVRMSTTMLVVEQTIEEVEYRVRISKAGDIINVQVATWKF